ncbi:Hpt domain-containing protein, partial [bacterium]|nr:Hpt domain-containing protein [bacterium]
MKLKDVTGLVTQAVRFLETMPEPQGAAARTLRGLFDEVAAGLAATGQDREAAKARKASLYCASVADGDAADPVALWTWIQGTAAAMERSAGGECDFDAAGYPADPAADGAVSLADDEILSEFLSRQVEQLQEVERLVLAVEKGEDAGDAAPMMRFFHTLKGEAGLLGLEDMARLAHVTEDMLTTEPVAACTERLLRVTDWFQNSLHHHEGRGAAPEPVADLIQALGEAPASAVAPEPAPEPAAEAAGSHVEASWSDVGLDEALFTVDHRNDDVELLQEFISESAEHLDEAEAQLLILESEPTQTDALNAVFRAFHTIKGVAGFVEMTHIQTLAHKAENLLDLARKGELTLQGDAMDL